MPNGVAVRLAPETSGPPASDPSPTEIAIGEAVVRAASAVGFMVEDWLAHGRVSPTNRTRGGAAVGRLYELSRGERDFAVVARRAGRLALLARLDAGRFAAVPAERDRAIDVIIDDLLGIVATVSAQMRASAN